MLLRAGHETVPNRLLNIEIGEEVLLLINNDSLSSTRQGLAQPGITYLDHAVIQIVWICEQSGERDHI